MINRTRSTVKANVNGVYKQQYIDIAADGTRIYYPVNSYNCGTIRSHSKQISDDTSTVWPARRGTVTIGPVNISTTERKTDGGGGQVYVYKYANGSSRIIRPMASDSFTMYCITNGLYPSSSFKPDPPSKVSQAKFQCLKLVDKPVEDFMEDVFEFRQTLSYLRNPLKGILDLTRMFQDSISRRTSSSKRFRNFERSKQVSSVFLEYRFAFSPLLQSAEAAINAYAMRHLVFPTIRHAKFNLKTESEQRLMSENGSFRSMNTQTLTRIDSAGIFYRSKTKRDFSTLTGLRLKNVPKTLWAIFPYSFMIDRVIDISGAISGLSNLFDPNIEIIGAYTSTKIERVVTRRIHSRIKIADPSLVQQSASGDEVTDTTESYSRDIWIPTAMDAIPSFDLSGLVKDALAITDLCALIVQRLR